MDCLADLRITRRFAAKESLKLVRPKAKADEESAELTVNRASLIEPHLVNQFFEHQRIIGK